MSIATNLFAIISGSQEASQPFDPATYSPSVHVTVPLLATVPLADADARRVTLFTIFNGDAAMLGQTTDLAKHLATKAALRAKGTTFHIVITSGLTKLQAKNAAKAVASSRENTP